MYNKTTNENGRLLLDYILECNLKSLNTSFKKRAGKLWTHKSPSGANSQIDYILIKGILPYESPLQYIKIPFLSEVIPLQIPCF